MDRALAPNPDARDASFANQIESEMASEVVRQACEADPALTEGVLETIPSKVVAFSHWSEPCDALPSGFLLRNASDEPIRVIESTVSPSSLGVTLESGVTIQPGDTIRGVLTQERVQPGRGTEGTLMIHTDAGCAKLEVLGVSTDEALSSVSELAIDFGVVPAGATSEVHKLKVMYQRSPSFSPDSEYSGFSAVPAGLFSIVEMPSGVVHPQSCEAFQLSVQLTAPAEASRVEGALTWFLTTELPEGKAEALVHIPLFGRVE